jgi:hypothetical protein
MTEFGKPQPCHNKCGAWIYFDSNSKPAHPSPDKWIPLEYSVDTGLRTGRVHQCPNRSEIQRSNGVDQQQGQALTTPATTETARSAITEALSRYDRALSIAQAAPSVSDKQDLMIAMLADLLNNIGKLIGILSEQQDQRTIQFDRLLRVLDELIELNKKQQEK